MTVIVSDEVSDAEFTDLPAVCIRSRIKQIYTDRLRAELFFTSVYILQDARVKFFDAFRVLFVFVLVAAVVA